MRTWGKLTLGAALVLASAVIVPIQAPAPAHAADYPSWSDVEAARSDERSAANAVAWVRDSIAQLATEVERTRLDLEVKSGKWIELDARSRAKQAETQTLAAQAEEAGDRATEAELRAGQWAAQVVKTTGSDPTLQLFVESDDASRILSAIGISSRVSQHASGLYETATQERNTAESLTRQSETAQAELEQLEADAAVAMAEAQAASEAASAALVAQQERQAQLEQMLIVLTERRAATEADYRVGEQVRLQEKLQEVHWADVSASGWVRPSSGWISSYYGNRAAGVGSSNHQGIDLAGGCWTPILAAASGTVTNASWHWSYGYNMTVNHGGGLRTFYAHMPSGGFTASVGQWVEVGTQIGHIGTTGSSTGCHLHFEVHTGNTTTDPLPFLAAHGVYL